MSSHATPRRSLAADTSWLVLAKTVAFAVTFVLPLVMVRNLSQEEFGHYRQLFLLVNTAVTLLPFGFVMSAFYFLPRCGNRGGAVAANILAVYAAIAAVVGVLLIIRPATLAAIFNNPQLIVYARLVAAVLFLTMLSMVIDLLMLANGDVKAAVMFILVSNLAKTAILSVAVISFASIKAVLIASLLHGVLQLTLLFRYLRRAFGSFLSRLDSVLLRKQLVYSTPLGLAYWLYWLQMESHHYFVARAFGATTYAIYAIGCVVLPLSLVVGDSIATLAIHRVSELHSQKRRGEVVTVLNEAIRNLSVFYLPLYALLLVTGRDLIPVIYTPKFTASWPIFAINLTLIPFSILGIFNDAVIRSYSECRSYLLGVRLVLVSVVLAGLWFLTPRYGPMAAISLVVASNVIERLVIAARTTRALNLRWSDATLLKGVLGIGACSLVAGVATAAVRSMLGQRSHGIALVISFLVFVTVYLVSTLLKVVVLGEVTSVVWWLGMLPEPLPQYVASLVQSRRARQSGGAGAKAA